MKKLFLSISLAFAAATAFATVQIQPTPDKPWRLYRLSDTQIKDAYTHNNYSGVEADWAGDADGDENYDDQHWTHYDHTWKFSPGGSGSRQDTDITVDWDGTVYTNATSGVMQWSPVDGIETDTANDGTVSTNLIGLPTFGDEHCIVNDPKNPPAVVYGLDGWDDDIVTNTYSEEYFRYAQTKWHLDTGGKALPQRQNLWQFNGWAKKILDKRAVPTFGGANMQDITNTQVSIGSICTLTADGTYWRNLTDGQSLDATPAVSGPDFYAFGVGAQKYTLTTFATTNGTAIDLSANVPEFCAGQTVNLNATWNPSLPSGVRYNSILKQGSVKWLLGGNFVDSYYYPTTGANPSLIYTNDPNWLTNEWAQAWWTSGDFANPPTYSAAFGEELVFPNGQSVMVARSGKIKMFRPSVTGFSVGSPRSFLMLTNEEDNLVLAYGNRFRSPPDFYGAWWDANINSKYNGSWGLTQTIRTLQTVWPSTMANFNSLSNAVADAGEFYDSPVDYGVTNLPSHSVHFEDFPEEPIAYAPLWTSVENYFADSQDYIRFKPSGDGIYVTLGIVKWNAHGIYSRISGWQENDTPAASSPDGSEAFPFWTDIATAKKTE